MAIATQVKVHSDKAACAFALIRQGAGEKYTRCISDRPCPFQNGATCTEGLMPLRQADNEDKRAQNRDGSLVAVILSMEFASKKPGSPPAGGPSDKNGNGGC
ncbi:MAG: hypothetical protein WC263_04960 [Candidatus Micrarchaeia archaeon]